MQDLYKDLEERLQELSNLSSVSNLLVRHVMQCMVMAERWALT